MATSSFQVASGATSAVYAVDPNMSILAGPSVLGGTATLSFSPNPSGPTNFVAWSFGASTGAQSFRPTQRGYIQVAAATQAANVAICDMNSAVGDRSPASLASINEAFASASSTAEQIIGSVRVPPGLLPLNGRLRISGMISMTNNANAKTAQIRVDGVGGTLLLQSPALASNANWNFVCEIGLRGDGVTQISSGEGATGGLGLSTTAYRTYSTKNYQTNELEYVVTCTKATGTDAMTLESLLVQLV